MSELEKYAAEQGREMRAALLRGRPVVFSGMVDAWLHFIGRHDLDQGERDEARGPFRRGWQSLQEVLQ